MRWDIKARYDRAWFNFRKLEPDDKWLLPREFDEAERLFNKLYGWTPPERYPRERGDYTLLFRVEEAIEKLALTNEMYPNSYPNLSQEEFERLVSILRMWRERLVRDHQH